MKQNTLLVYEHFGLNSTASRIIHRAKGVIAQGHPKIGGTKLVDRPVDILVVYIIFLYLGQSYLLILPDKKKGGGTIIFLCPVAQKS